MASQRRPYLVSRSSTRCMLSALGLDRCVRPRSMSLTAWCLLIAHAWLEVFRLSAWLTATVGPTAELQPFFSLTCKVLVTLVDSSLHFIQPWTCA